MVTPTLGYCMACSSVHLVGDARDPLMCDAPPVLELVVLEGGKDAQSDGSDPDGECPYVAGQPVLMK